MPNVYTNVPIPTKIPSAFLIKRLHSITGLFFIFFLIEHLITNSEAALFFGEDGSSFIQSVNFLQSLPYLPVIELFGLGAPIAIHGIIGIVFVCSSLYNCFYTDGSSPCLPYTRNICFTLQRITAAFLLIAVISHVASMRFFEKPRPIEYTHQFYIHVTKDPGLFTLIPRLHATLFTKDSKSTLIAMTQKNIKDIEQSLSSTMPKSILEKKHHAMTTHMGLLTFLKSQKVDDEHWIAITPTFGTACLLLVRDTMKSWYMCFLYAFFIFIATFHAANGLWTFCITWGITQNEQGRGYVRIISLLLFSLLTSCGLVTIFGTYFFNLYE